MTSFLRKLPSTTSPSKGLPLLTVLLALALLLGCSRTEDPASSRVHAIHYNFSLQTTPIPDTLAALSSPDSAYRTILNRLKENTKIRAFLPRPASFAILSPLIATLRTTSGIELDLLFPPHAWNADTSAAKDSIKAWQAEGLLSCPNTEIDFVLPDTQDLDAGIISLRNIQATMQDDGEVSLIWLRDNGTGSRWLSGLMAVYGDPGLVRSFDEYWTALSEGRGAGTLTRTETYTDLYRHRIHYYPSGDRIYPLDALLSRLDTGLTRLSRPARIRLLAAQVPPPHRLESISALVRMHDIDCMALWGTPADSAQTVSLTTFPMGDQRYVQLPPSAIPSLMLIDGPMPADTLGLPTRHRMVMLGQFNCFDDFAPLTRSGIILELSNERLFELAHLYWQRLWDMSDNVPLAVERQARNSDSLP